MKDTIVSVRMPSSLVLELKDVAKQNHYVDLSEQIRDIIRKKYSEHIETQKPKETETEDKKQLMKELKIILEKLDKEL